MLSDACLFAGIPFPASIEFYKLFYLLGLHNRQSYLIVIKNRGPATIIHFSLSNPGPNTPYALKTSGVKPWTGYGLRFIDKRRFDVHGDGPDNPTREKYGDGLGLFFSALEPKQSENDGHNDSHRYSPTYEWIHAAPPILSSRRGPCRGQGKTSFKESR